MLIYLWTLKASIYVCNCAGNNRSYHHKIHVIVLKDYINLVKGICLIKRLLDDNYSSGESFSLCMTHFNSYSMLKWSTFMCWYGLFFTLTHCLDSLPWLLALTPCLEFLPWFIALTPCLDSLIISRQIAWHAWFVKVSPCQTFVFVQHKTYSTKLWQGNDLITC